MSTTLSHKVVTAIKDHKCNFCGGVIEPKTQYSRAGLLHDGRLYTWKSHLRCDQICSKLNMEGDEGVTSDDFWEYIVEEYYKLLGEGEEPVKRTYYERLEIACNHHLDNQKQ